MQTELAPRRRLRLVAGVISGLALGYALYRAYYALGGSAGMVGQPTSHTQWLAINAIGAVAIAVAAIVPLVALPLLRRPLARRCLIVLFSVAAVGLVGHALTDDLQRALSLSGLAERWRIPLATDSMAGWISKDQHAADVQDLVFNETWFLVEGLLCGTFAWTALRPGAPRRWWLVAVACAVLVFFVYGAVSALGVIGRQIWVPPLASLRL